MANREPAEDVRLASRKLADILRAEIEQGTAYPPGTKLKSYRQLAADHDVAPNTAQAAVRILQAEGLVTIRAASGAYVRDPSAAAGEDDLPSLRSELAQIRERVRRTHRELTAAEQALTELLERLPPEGPAP